MSTIYQAWVEVHGTEGYRYWNKLATPKTSRVEAEADVATYLRGKLDGNGFRKGAASRTRISEHTS